MPDYDQAEAVARCWVQFCSRGVLELDPDAIMVRPYGWVFGFRALRPASGGWIGLLFDRVNGDVLAIGTGDGALESYIARYEARIPVARLTMKPEFPPGGTHSRGDFNVVEPDKPLNPSTFPEPLLTLHKMKS